MYLLSSFLIKYYMYVDMVYYMSVFMCMWVYPPF